MSGQGVAGSMGVTRRDEPGWRDEVARRNGLAPLDEPARRDEPAWRVHAAGFAPLIAALGLVGACSSTPPTHFYTLSDTAPAAAAPAGVGWVRIVNLTIPGELDRPELVRRIGPNQLSIAGLDRWAAPLDETIRRALSDDIARRVPAPVPGQQYAVSVEIREFYGDSTCNVSLRAAWTVKPSHPEGARSANAAPANPVPVNPVPMNPLPVNEEIQVPSSGSCPATLAATMSVALGQLSDRIIAGVARMPAPAPATTPSPAATPAAAR
jgi:uncharacterized lipoprotein YmbA